MKNDEAKKLLEKLIDSLKKVYTKEKAEAKTYRCYCRSDEISDDTNPEASFDTVEEAAEWAMKQGNRLVTIIDKDFNEVYCDFPNKKTKKVKITMNVDNDKTMLKAAKIAQLAATKFLDDYEENSDILAVSRQTKVSLESEKPSLLTITVFKKEK